MLFVPLLMLSCEDKMKEHYEVPDWLKGSAWEVLDSKKDYTIFLEAAEKAGYRPILEGKSILTVMAPNDAAFASYLQKTGHSSISDLSASELKKLIGFHLLYYSYNTGMMINFRPEGDGSTEDQKETRAGLYYKFRTRSSNTPSVELNPATGRDVTVYHLERFIPVFSYKFFQTKGIDAKTNYEYFYPNTTWKGNTGFNVSNAAVDEYGIMADNGYIYAVDQVLEPLETIYTELKSRNNYSVFFNLYDSYKAYEYDATLTKDYGSTIGADSLFLHKHTNLPPIAMEWPISDYRAVHTLAYTSYSVFAPSNAALNGFFTQYWGKGGYASLDKVDQLVMKYLLMQYVYPGSVVFPDEIKKGIKNGYDAKIEFDPAGVTDKKMCVNGSFYGINSLITPALFASVVGPAFQYKDFCNYLYMLDGSDLLLSLVSTDTKFITLVPSNSQLESADIHLKTYTTGKVLQKTGEDGGFADISSSEMQRVVNMHVSNSATAFKTSGTQVFPTQIPFNYWFIKDGTITSSGEFTQYINPEYHESPFVTFKELVNDTPWSNGHSYEYKGSTIFRSESSDGLKYSLSICNDSRYPYYLFSQLLKKAGQVTAENSIKMLNGRFVAFIPTNEAIKKALADKTIPGVTNGGVDASGALTGTYNANVLAGYLNSYFITSELNVLTTYPYLGSPMKSGEYMTPGTFPILKYTDNGTSLNVQMNGRTATGTTISDYFSFPFAFEDGCFHLIDATL